ncbi:hypothetical protein DM02DRAFT_650404 [Periconia macrospinosa]|uniref:Uncharacterized protein n=1 Tax=Periconia macrospinosa TaxID=97972 RepID=A0A2V1E8T9_9PLEO|nr:hypothetical protein DM02DRAFT_650404 [Periconia macrospinosa]
MDEDNSGSGLVVIRRLVEIASEDSAVICGKFSSFVGRLLPKPAVVEAAPSQSRRQLDMTTIGKSDFQFITFGHANDFNSKSNRRAVRSHIIKRIAQRRKTSFKITTAQHLDDAQSESPFPPGPTIAISCEVLDPFGSLSVDQSELHVLLRHLSAQQAVEPVFSISDAFTFHNLHGAYANAFTDSAFSSALMCAISLGKHKYILMPDVLYHQGQAINYINKQLTCSLSYECIIGNAKTHLKGIQKLLRVCEKEQIILSASVRRGIFWQDVNAAIVSDTERVMERNMFPEFQWGRANFMVEWSVLPSGFESLRHELGEKTVQVLQDVYVIQK